MAKASPIITALNAGEWSPLLDGRTDLVGYAASAYRCENFIPTIQGPAVRRAGTEFIAQRKGSGRTWLMPFIKSRDDAVMIEFGNLYCRFYANRGVVVSTTTRTITGITKANPAVVTSAAHGYANGQDVFISGVVGMTQVNGRWFKVAGATANTYQLTTIHGTNVNSTGYGTYSSGGTSQVPYELVSPYSTTLLQTPNGEFDLDYIQSGDVIYITHRSGAVKPQKLSRTSATSWTFTAIDPSDGPWLDLNSTATTIYAGAATGTGVTLTASASIFTANDVGSLIRIDQEVITSTQPWVAGKGYGAGVYVRSEGKEYYTAAGGTSGTSIPAHTSGTVADGGVNWQYTSSGYGIARITAQAGTTATVDILTRFPQTLVGPGNASTLWQKGAWSIAANGYPKSVTFFRERLAFGQDQRIDLSVASDFESFATDYFGEVLPESAVSLTVYNSTSDDVVGLHGEKVLVALTSGGEFVVEAPATSEPFGPNNVRVAPQTAFGARPIQPVRVGEQLLMIQSSGQKLRSIQYSYQTESFIAPDMMVRSEHIGRPRITQIARQESPHQTIWGVRSDGQIVSFAFDQTQEVRAWARHVLGGTAASVKCIAIMPSPDGTRDDLWMIVDRTINGATRSYVEYMRAEYATGDDRSAAAYLDSGLYYNSTSATTLYGYDHLEGQTVGLMIDGASAADVVVSGGVVTLPVAGAKVQVGLKYTSTYATNRLDGGAGDGTAQAKTKRITDVVFRVLDTLGGQAGPVETLLDDVPDLTFRAPATPMGSPPPLFTGDALVQWPGGYETDGRIWYRNATVYPATILAIMPQVVVQEAR